jgi:hypothetical protein
VIVQSVVGIEIPVRIGTLAHVRVEQGDLAAQVLPDGSVCLRPGAEMEEQRFAAGTLEDRERDRHDVSLIVEHDEIGCGHSGRNRDRRRHHARVGVRDGVGMRLRHAQYEVVPDGIDRVDNADRRELVHVVTSNREPVPVEHRAQLLIRERQERCLVQLHT